MSDRQRPTIFLSSTFVDLGNVRASIKQWLVGLFGADVLIMETFGSDAAPPNINSVRKVRECDIFVGVYALRYGTVNEQSGKSITELELDEASRAFSSGTLTDILLYLVDEGADWPSEQREDGQVAQAGLERLRSKASQHTYTKFRTEQELLYSVVRDVYQRLSQHLSTPLSVREFALPRRRTLRRPTGMEFLASPYRDYLIGREEELLELGRRLDKDRFVLLLGDSGVGKTSLIHGGLIPKAVQEPWRPIYTRPLGFPYTDVARQILATVYEGRPTYTGPLVPLLAEVTAATGEETLLIIDQFEDILAPQDQGEAERLVSELRVMYEVEDPSLRVLISYRADLEGRLGRYWQTISGSPSGLSRVYLGGLDAEVAVAGIERAGRSLGLELSLTDQEWARLRNDLSAASRAGGFQGIYPPYLQMTIDHLWFASKSGTVPYRFSEYRRARGMEGIIGGYLERQLEYASDSHGHARAVLVSLVRSYGVKAQRSLDQIIVDTGLDGPTCESALERLVDLRLVRPLDGMYEISHDFVARRVISEIADSEEREVKRFRELLASKAAAFAVTASILTEEELLMIFKHKERVAPTAAELRLLLACWIRAVGPALYWLVEADRAQTLEWLRAEESRPGLEREEKVSIVLLRNRLGEQPFIDEDYGAFREYQLSAETAALFRDASTAIPNGLLLSGTGHVRDEVRNAAIDVIAEKIKAGEWSWIGKLRRSSSARRREAYHTLILRDDVPIPEGDGEGDRSLEEFALLKRIGLSSGESGANAHLRHLRRKRPPADSWLFGSALVSVGSNRIQALANRAANGPRHRAGITLRAVSGNISEEGFDALVRVYENLNSREGARDKTPAVYAKAAALASAIARCSARQRMPRLRGLLSRIKLKPSSRSLVLALLRRGRLIDIRALLEGFAAETDRIDFWNHTELGHAVANNFAETVSGVPDFLARILRKAEFWEYVPPDDRMEASAARLLPLSCPDNRALYVRIAAYGIIGAATTEEQSILMRLALHDYRLVARDATVRLVRLAGENALRDLSTLVEQAMERGRSRALATALRSAEIELYGLAKFW